MTCILCNEPALSGRKYCAVHQVQANSQSLEQKLTAQREAFKQRSDMKIAVNELLRDFNVTVSNRIQFIDAVTDSAWKILKSGGAQ